MRSFEVYEKDEVDDEISKLEDRVSDPEKDLERAEAQADSLSEELGMAEDTISDLREQVSKVDV